MPHEPAFFNPLDKRNLGRSVADALLERPLEPLPPQTSFVGAGIYAIYYTGLFGPYRPITKPVSDKGEMGPIYVGKAIPAGARKGGVGLDEPAGTVLYNRLYEHARSIEQASNLELGDFTCRYLITDDIWIPLGESLLIARFSPLWNMVVEGFGNHDPGGGRRKQQRSNWDVLHPGRNWADLQSKGKPIEEISAKIRQFLERN